MTRADFQRTIAANLGHDGPGLVYADWCEERDEMGLAELLRSCADVPALSLSLSRSRPRSLSRSRSRSLSLSRSRSRSRWW